MAMWNNGKASVYSRNMSEIPHPGETSAGKAGSKKWKYREKKIKWFVLENSYNC